MAGRGWYWVRRVAADAAEDVEKDERVLNSITGHRDSATHRNIYQTRERPEALNKAAITRGLVRRGAPTCDGAAEEPHALELVSNERAG